MSESDHQPVDTNQLHDRLLDTALAEVVGGKAPPDLSARILEADRPSPATPSHAPAKLRPFGRRRRYWIEAAVAVSVMLVIAALMLPSLESARETAHPARALGAAKTAATPAETSDGPNASATTSAILSEDAVDLPPELAAQLQRSVTAPTAPDNLSANSPTKAEAIGLHGLVDDARVNASQSAPTHERLMVGVTVDGDSGLPAEESFNSLHDARADRYATVKELGQLQKQTPLHSREVVRRGKSSTDGTVFAMDETVTHPAETPPSGSVNDASSDNLDLLASQTHAWGYHQPADGERDWSEAQLRMMVTPRVIIQDGDEDRLWLENADMTELGTGPGLSGDQYTRIFENPFVKAVGGDAVSTFSIDVDTASYANVRQFLLGMNQLPPPDAVRIEELVNYFDYDYAPPAEGDEDPFAAHVEVAGCPWTPEHRLVRIGIKGREMDADKRPPSNLVFLVDVSGSMDEPQKLPLVVHGLRELARELGENDRVAIVVYASSEGLALPSTTGDKQETILAALGRLQAGGSTAGGAGIQLAYQIAEDNFIQGGTNRVVLCTDGDFNVGVTSTAELQRMVEKKAKDTGVFLSVLGFGRGNLNDAMMETISNHGNGNYHYVDNQREARKVLVEEMAGTLVTIAKDVKIQVEFNPARVSGYRLLGYENRMLRTEDFNDDTKDAGEIGAGHTVTALYEIVPAGRPVDAPPVDDLKYQQSASDATPVSDELLTLKMRYKEPDGDVSKKLEWPVTDSGHTFTEATGDFQFATAVAGFGLCLRDSQYKGNLTYDAVVELAEAGLGADPHGYRGELVDLVRRAKDLSGK